MALRYARMAVATLWYYSAYDRQEERLMYCPNCAAQIEGVQFRPDVCPKRLKPRQLRVLTDLTRFYAWSNLEAHGPFED